MRTIPRRTTHLIDIPVGLQVGEVANAGVGAMTFHILVVPQGEGVVVAVGEDDGVALFVERIEGSSCQSRGRRCDRSGRGRPKSG